MKTIIFADRAGHELDPVCQHVCPALLQIAGKPVLEHTIEDLAGNGLTDVTLVVGPHAADIQKTIGGGDRWGIRVRYASSRSGEPAADILRRLETNPGEPFLCLRGDVVRSPMVAEFLASAESMDWRGTLAARAGSRNAWMVLAETESGNFQMLDPGQVTRDTVGDTVNIRAGKVTALANCDEYFRSALKAASGMFNGLIVAGFPAHAKQRLGRFSRAPQPGSRVRHMLVGNYSRLAETVTTQGTVVIGDHCLVDENTHLADCVVLPGTYVGADLEVRHAIIGPGFMIRLDLGVVVPIDDPLWSARMHPAGHKPVGLGARCAGLVLLALSLPLWPLALLAALLETPHAPWQRRVLAGNRRTPSGAAQPFASFVFATSIPLLRHLPRLLAVVTGHLRMFGARPGGEMDHGVANAEWERARMTLPAGVLGPLQLHLAPGAPEEEIYLNEVIFNEGHGPVHGLACFRDALAALISPRAWRAAP